MRDVSDAIGTETKNIQLIFKKRFPKIVQFLR
jgi:hypothetical protein